MMEYRDIPYTVVQGIGRHLWKWSASVADEVITGQAHSSFQDLLGRDAAGNIKPKNEWLHTVNWDLVVFDEYHFGAWRDTAKELFEGEEEAVAKKEAKLEYPHAAAPASFHVQTVPSPRVQRTLTTQCLLIPFA
jgi:hypothetical protein